MPKAKAKANPKPKPKPKNKKLSDFINAKNTVPDTGDSDDELLYSESPEFSEVSRNLTKFREEGEQPPPELKKAEPIETGPSLVQIQQELLDLKARMEADAIAREERRIKLAEAKLIREAERQKRQLLKAEQEAKLRDEHNKYLERIMLASKAAHTTALASQFNKQINTLRSSNLNF